MYTLSWLIFCYVNFTSRGRSKQRRKKRKRRKGREKFYLVTQACKEPRHSGDADSLKPVSPISQMMKLRFRVVRQDVKADVRLEHRSASQPLHPCGRVL